jgi:LysR family glycine cleavage system transcriptional activator
MVDVRISATSRLVDFARDRIDLAIRHGLGRYPGLLSDKILDDDLIAVCSPLVVKRKKQQIHSADDLRQFAFLHDEHDDDWRLWLSAAGVKDADWAAGPILPNSKAVIEAAVAGEGLALVRASMIRAELRNGRLVQPLPARLKVDFGYYVVYPLGALDRHDAASFREWLLEQARLDRTAADGSAQEPVVRRKQSGAWRGRGKIQVIKLRRTTSP